MTFPIFRKKGILFLTAVLLAFGGLFFFYWDFPSKEGSQSLSTKPLGLVFSETEHDFGKVNGPVQHTFEFKNVGLNDLKIVAVRSSCSCAVGDLSTKFLKPGDQGKITVKINPTRQKHGRHSFAVDFDYQNGNEKKSQRLKLFAEKQIDLLFPDKPIELISFGTGPAKAHVPIIDYRQEPLKIKEIKTSFPHLSARLSEFPTVYINGRRNEKNICQS